MRQEHDLLGYRDVPDEAYYGVQTLRCTENFNITGVHLRLSGFYKSPCDGETGGGTGKL